MTCVPTLTTTTCAHTQGQALFCAYHLRDKGRRKMLQLLLEVTVANTGAEGGQKSKQNNGCMSWHGMPPCILGILFTKECSRKMWQWKSLGTCKSFCRKNKAKRGSRKIIWRNTEEHTHTKLCLSKAPGYFPRQSIYSPWREVPLTNQPTQWGYTT